MAGLTALKEEPCYAEIECKLGAMGMRQKTYQREDRKQEGTFCPWGQLLRT